MRHPTCMGMSADPTGEESYVTIMEYRLGSAKIRSVVITCAALVLAASSCTDDDKDAACSWLSAPASFVEAPIAPGCTAEPAGQRCDPSSGVCSDVCPPGQYHLTCAVAESPRYSTPEEAIRDPVIGGRKSGCTALGVDAGASRTRAEYCCQCE
jgi:hypothetical protein